MENWLTHSITFLVGALTGAAGHYYGEKYTDQRRLKESYKSLISSFVSIEEQIPELITEMREDLKKHIIVREFIVTTSSKIIVDTRKTPLGYFENEHKHLTQQLALLENNQCISKISDAGGLTFYRFSEKFAEWLLQS
jgi:hypothetical protein